MASKIFSGAFSSTVIKKILMAVTGLFLVLFVIIHMLGNLSFVLGGSDAFNLYSHKLLSLGPLIILIEIVLLIAFLLHAWNAVIISLDNNKARPQKYAQLKSIGNPSKKNISSTTMIWTGLLLLAFTAIHVKTFKYGTYYATEINGETVRDLYRLVMEVFQSPLYAFGYIIMMVLLGYHLRHGFWSAFQSLGANHPRYSGMIYTIGVIIAIVLAVGFMIVPVTVYFNLV